MSEWTLWSSISSMTPRAIDAPVEWDKKCKLGSILADDVSDLFDRHLNLHRQRRLNGAYHLTEVKCDRCIGLVTRNTMKEEDREFGTFSSTNHKNGSTQKSTN
ncbi:hypothetical protein PsorP6_015323 [Peronosclerospora sorghi]|uniref:Uncharacterized protein n=1 Tax=Peronosclerospora sorghi TaxID=230839 RepID=A0ACC0VUM0_9STRA|nr:hypothetical protein PsorP6_015323 [Peronosclerospora sorghi]